MTKAVSDLTAHLGYWLRQISNHVSHAFARKLAGKDVTVAEWAMMRMLFDGLPTSPSKLADSMGMTRGAVTKLADRLVMKGFVVRKASTEDGRSQTLCLTPAGANLVPELATLADLNDAECFAHLSDSECKALDGLLRKSVERLGLKSIPID